MCAAAEGKRTFCSLHQIEFLRVTEQYLFQQPLTALRRCMPVISCLKSEENENLSNCVDFFYTAARRTGTECLPYKLVRGKRLHRHSCPPSVMVAIRLLAAQSAQMFVSIMMQTKALSNCSSVWRTLRPQCLNQESSGCWRLEDGFDRYDSPSESLTLGSALLSKKKGL